MGVWMNPSQPKIPTEIMEKQSGRFKIKRLLENTQLQPAIKQKPLPLWSLWKKIQVRTAQTIHYLRKQQTILKPSPLFDYRGTDITLTDFLKGTHFHPA